MLHTLPSHQIFYASQSAPRWVSDLFCFQCSLDTNIIACTCTSSSSTLYCVQPSTAKRCARRFGSGTVMVPSSWCSVAGTLVYWYNLYDLSTPFVYIQLWSATPHIIVFLCRKRQSSSVQSKWFLITNSNCPCGFG